MLIEILFGIVIGCLFGVFTGLIPGIHINLISVLLASVATVFDVPVLFLICFIVSMSLVHSFIDVIPSIYLGAPDESQVLGVLPGHRLLHKGLGHQAIMYTVLGSLGGLIFSITLFYLFYKLVFIIDYVVKPSIGYVLIIIALWMITRDRKKLYAIYIFFISGVLGYLVLNFQGLENPLFPLLSGLFGVSTLIYSIMEKENKIPEQNFNEPLNFSKIVFIKSILAGQFSGFITAVLPGIGSGTAAVISQSIARKIYDYGFLILIGSISTVNFILSIATWYVLDKARNGSVIAMKSFVQFIDINLVILILIVMIVSGGIATILTIKISKKFCRIITKINYKKLIISIIVLIFVLCFFLSGIFGIYVLIISTSLGLIPAIVKTQRIHAMGCLLLPVILYFMSS